MEIICSYFPGLNKESKNMRAKVQGDHKALQKAKNLLYSRVIYQMKITCTSSTLIRYARFQQNDTKNTPVIPKEAGAYKYTINNSPGLLQPFQLQLQLRYHQLKHQQSSPALLRMTDRTADPSLLTHRT